MNPKLGLLTPDQLMLFTDYYELTSGRVNFDLNFNPIITACYFFRRVPRHLGAYVLAVGLEQFIAHVEALNNCDFRPHSEWLRETCGGDLDDKFLTFLEDFQFDGDIWAVPEGTPMFPNEPIINIRGRSIESQILETSILNSMDFPSLVATKASRMRYVAGKRSVVDFGARRAHGRDAAMLAARASYIGGADGTSLVIASEVWDIPYIGTMPHKFIQERSTLDDSFKESELKSFVHYTAVFPHNALLLVDTYNSIDGIMNAIKIAHELRRKGYELKGIRLDSGNLTSLSKIARTMLDAAGLSNVRVYISGDLDEFIAKRMLDEGAPVDGFGIGTRLVTGANFNSLTNEGGASALGGVFKLTSVNDSPTMKFTDSKGKTTLPALKQVWRRYDKRGHYNGDVISLMTEEVEDAEPLLIRVMEKGKIVYDFPSTKTIRSHAGNELRKLRPAYRRISGGSPIYPVSLSSGLSALKDDLLNRYTEQFGSSEKPYPGIEERKKALLTSIAKYLDQIEKY